MPPSRPRQYQSHSSEYRLLIYQYAYKSQKYVFFHSRNYRLVSNDNMQSAQFSLSVMSGSLQPHEPQHAWLPCLSATSMSWQSTQTHVHWIGEAIQPSVVPFASSPQSFPASVSFPLSQLFTSGGQSTGASASTSVLPMNTQDWSPLGWTSWMSLQFKGLSRVFSNTTVQKHQFFSAQFSSQSNSHIHAWPLEKS